MYYSTPNTFRAFSYPEFSPSHKNILITFPTNFSIPQCLQSSTVWKRFPLYYTCISQIFLCRTVTRRCHWWSRICPPFRST